MPSALSSKLTDQSSNVDLMPLKEGKTKSRSGGAGSNGSGRSCISVLPAAHGSCTQPGSAAWPSELQQPLDAALHAAMLARQSRLASAKLSWRDCLPLLLPLAVCCMSACEAMQPKENWTSPAARLTLTYRLMVDTPAYTRVKH